MTDLYEMGRKEGERMKQEDAARKVRRQAKQQVLKIYSDNYKIARQAVMYELPIIELVALNFEIVTVLLGRQLAPPEVTK